MPMDHSWCLSLGFRQDNVCKVLRRGNNRNFLEIVVGHDVFSIPTTICYDFQHVPVRVSQSQQAAESAVWADRRLNNQKSPKQTEKRHHFLLLKFSREKEVTFTTERQISNNKYKCENFASGLNRTRTRYKNEC